MMPWTPGDFAEDLVFPPGLKISSASPLVFWIPPTWSALVIEHRLPDLEPMEDEDLEADFGLLVEYHGTVGPPPPRDEAELLALVTEAADQLLGAAHLAARGSEAVYSSGNGKLLDTCEFNASQGSARTLRARLHATQGRDDDTSVIVMGLFNQEDTLISDIGFVVPLAMPPKDCESIRDILATTWRRLLSGLNIMSPVSKLMLPQRTLELLEGDLVSNSADDKGGLQSLFAQASDPSDQGRFFAARLGMALARTKLKALRKIGSGVNAKSFLLAATEAALDEAAWAEGDTQRHKLPPLPSKKKRARRRPKGASDQQV